jgi:predicted HicB family RNase H-like nuclease
MTSSIIGKEEKLEHDTIIFRIDQDIANVLRPRIKAKKASLNILVIQILGFYVNRNKPSK